jgi:hypothetical protein
VSIHVVVPSFGWTGPFQLPADPSQQSASASSSNPRASSSTVPTNSSFAPRPVLSTFFGSHHAGYPSNSRAQLGPTNPQSSAGAPGRSSASQGWPGFVFYASALGQEECARFLRELTAAHSALDRRLRAAQTLLSRHTYTFHAPEADATDLKVLADTDAVTSEVEKLARKLGLDESLNSAEDTARRESATLAGDQCQRIVHIAYVSYCWAFSAMSFLLTCVRPSTGVALFF